MEEKSAPIVMSPNREASLDAVRNQLVLLLPRLRRYAVALTGSVHDGDDLVQDTVERALKSLHQWQAGTSLSSWMFRIAKNRFIDTRRAVRASPTVAMGEVPEEAVEAHSDGARTVEASLTLRDVVRALQSLPIEQRDAVALVLIDGASYREAADILGIPIGTLTSRIARARAALADLLGAS
jgi:RNA polymerase sigma factor (sigma-70 family)